MATKKDENRLFAPVTVQSPWKSGNAIQNLKLDGGNLAQQGVEDNTPPVSYEEVSRMETAPGHLSEESNVKAVEAAPKPSEVWENTPEAMNYDRMLEEFNRRHPAETDEEKRNRLKRQRRNQLFAALGDGISALSNLYFTTKGSPSADQSKTMSKALRERYDKDDKEREAEERSDLNTMLSIMNQKRLAHAAWLSKKNQEELVELRRKAIESGNMAALRRVEELRRYHTELAQIERENKEAERKRKEEELKNKKEKDDKLVKIAEDKKNAFVSGVANQNANRNSRTANSNKNADRRTAIQAAKGRGNSKYNPASDPNMMKVTRKNYAKGETYQYYQQKPSAATPKKKLRKNNMGL